MARQTRQFKLGEADGREYAEEALREGHRATLEELARGDLGEPASEGLINALTEAELASFLGVARGSPGWAQAVCDYDRGYAIGVVRRLAEEGAP